MQHRLSHSRRFVGWLASEPFFWGIVALLIIQATWLALTGRYPMAFDENFHLGIIQLYAHHLSPFWSSQPTNANAYGAVARDPSYLYQYLMSFPYRLISTFTHDLTIQVLILRALNIILMASSLPLFRCLLQKTGASRALTHSALAVYVLIPVVPLLAAQINYDNMVIPLTALTLLLTIRLNEKLVARKPLDIQLCLSLTILCLLTSLVKYSFLPIFLAIMLFLAIRCWQVYGRPRQFLVSVHSGLRRTSHRMWWLYGGMTIIALGLFAQRYGVNVVLYHNPVPNCDQVLTVQQCSAYGPWERDYEYKQYKNSRQPSATTKPGTAAYIGDWFYGMWFRTFFAVDGPATNFETREPLSVPGVAAVIFAVTGVLAVIITARRLVRDYHAPTLLLFLLVPAAYIGVLFLDEYQSYLSTAQPVAINGRYLLPVLPLILVIIALAYGELLKRWLAAKLLLASVAIVSLLWGGGALTYILRSNQNWYWPAHSVYEVNHAVQDVLGPRTPGYDSPMQFSL
jgi:hypothetical protein